MTTETEARAEIAAANREGRPPWGKTTCDRCGAAIWPAATKLKPAMVGPDAAFCFDCFLRFAIGGYAA